MAQQTYRVANAAGMWLRTAPRFEQATETVLLPQGQLVIRVGETDKPDWWYVSTNFQGAPCEGFVPSTLLISDAEFVLQPEPGSVSPLNDQLQEQLTEAEIRKTNLEIKHLQHPWKDFAKWFPLVASFVAMAGFGLTFYQSATNTARNESLSRTQQIQAQIRADKDQLINFITDQNFSTARVVFLLDDLDSLLDQVTQGVGMNDQVSNPELERQKITDLLQIIAWQLPFDEERHVDFDVQALQRWEPYKSFWVKNGPSHHLLLSKKYYIALSNAYLQDTPCVNALEYDAKRGVYVSSSGEHKDCERGIFPVLLVGFKAHLQIMEDAQQTEWVRRELEEFERLTNNAPVAVKFRKDFEASLLRNLD